MGTRWKSGKGALAAVALMCAGQAPAEEARLGLLWNRSGLPAVFPLQIKSPEGPDLHLLLTDAATGGEVLAAAVPGGEPFRLLVPAGSFMAEFTAGGGAARRVTVGPLTFRVVGEGRKAGHLVALAAGPAGALMATVRGFGLCQTPEAEAGPVAPDAPGRVALPQQPPPELPGEPVVRIGPPALTRSGPPALLRGPDDAAWGPLARPRSAIPDRPAELRLRMRPCD